MAPAQWGEQWCKDGADQQKCYDWHVAIPALGPATGTAGDLCYRCPVPGHGNRRKNCAINPGTKGKWVVWHCFGGCTDAAVRQALSGMGISEDCLGSFASDDYYEHLREVGQREPVPGMPNVAGVDPAAFAAAQRWAAIQQVLATDIANLSLVRMCAQAISEGDGGLAGDPKLLLPGDQAAFVALAKRAGIERRYRYELAKKWSSAA